MRLALQVPEEERICYVPWDFHAFAKQRGGHILADLQPVIQQCLDSTGLYTSCEELQVCSQNPPSFPPPILGQGPPSQHTLSESQRRAEMHVCKLCMWGAKGCPFP